MKARDQLILIPKPPPAFDPDHDIGPLPERLNGIESSEVWTVRFRCGSCGIPCQAAILPASPQIAKFRCRRCGEVSEIETRPSVMDSIEQEFNLRVDMKNVDEKPKAFTKP